MQKTKHLNSKPVPDKATRSDYSQYPELNTLIQENQITTAEIQRIDEVDLETFSKLFGELKRKGFNATQIIWMASCRSSRKALPLVAATTDVLLNLGFSINDICNLAAVKNGALTIGAVLFYFHKLVHTCKLDIKEIVLIGAHSGGSANILSLINFYPYFESYGFNCSEQTGLFNNHGIATRLNVLLPKLEELYKRGISPYQINCQIKTCKSSNKQLEKQIESLLKKPLCSPDRIFNKPSIIKTSLPDMVKSKLIDDLLKKVEKDNKPVTQVPIISSVNPNPGLNSVEDDLDKSGLGVDDDIRSEPSLPSPFDGRASSGKRDTRHDEPVLPAKKARGQTYGERRSPTIAQGSSTEDDDNSPLRKTDPKQFQQARDDESPTTLPTRSDRSTAQALGTLGLLKTGKRVSSQEDRDLDNDDDLADSPSR